MSRTIHRVCTLCEATCGIRVEVEDGRISSIRGDDDDPFSRGYLCPKAWGLKQIQEDPDRLRTPLRRTETGWEEIGWDEAFTEAIGRLTAIRETHGPDAIGSYLGNPSAHSLHAMIYGPVLLRALGGKQRFSASSADQLPKMVSAGLMFGAGLTIPVPDLDRTDLLLLLGGNPLASNGSLMTAPDVGKRLRDIVERGGRVVVVDPRRSETASIATEHHFIRPGTDAYFLLAIVHAVLEGPDLRLGRAEGLVDGLDRVRERVRDLSPETVADRCGIGADVIRGLARDLRETERAACYGRIGTTCQEFGTLASWAVDLVNVLTGNLDVPGGAMFARPAAGLGQNRAPGTMGGRGVALERWRSRVQGLPEMFGEIPVSTLADEIEIDGPGEGDGETRIRALLTVAGNPALSAPGAERLDRALASLDFMVSVDFYLNETTRHADLILPPPAPPGARHLRHRPVPAGHPQRGQVLAARPRPAAGPTRRVGDPAHPRQGHARHERGRPGVGRRLRVRPDRGEGDRLRGRPVGRLDRRRGPGRPRRERGPARILDLLLRIGPYGDGFGREPDGLHLDRLREEVHGVDLGALEEQLPEVLRTPGGRIDLAPGRITGDLPRLLAALERPAPATVLIGRRHLRSNNSWCHNLPALVKGKERCTLLIHPADAARVGVADGGRARVTSRVGSVVAPVAISDEMMEGVVSLPHGWGHDADGTRLSVASSHPGVNVNVLSDPEALDALSGNAAFNGVPVEIEPA